MSEFIQVLTLFRTDSQTKEKACDNLLPRPLEMVGHEFLSEELANVGPNLRRGDDW